MTPCPAALNALADRLDLGETGRTIDREVMAQFFTWGERHIGVRDAGTEEAVTTGVWIDPATGRWTTSAIDGYEVTSSLEHIERLRKVALPDVALGSTTFGMAWAGNDGLMGDDTITVSIKDRECNARLSVMLRFKARQLAAEAGATSIHSVDANNMSPEETKRES